MANGGSKAKSEPQQTLVLDERKSWKNLPVALAPAAVGIWLLVAPWTTDLNPSTVAPIMIPFGIVWLLIALCISSYNSYVVLDEEHGEVVYNVSLLLHSWANKMARGNVSGVVVEPIAGKFRFVMKAIEGEDLTVTTSDYWQAREWGKQVATFLTVPLVDDCRPDEQYSGDFVELTRSLAPKFPEETPTQVTYIEGDNSRSQLILPSRGIGRSQRPRIFFGTVCLTLGILAAFQYSPWYLPVGLILTAILWSRPLARASHCEELIISPNGLVARITIFGRTRSSSIATSEIRSVSIVEGQDVRFDHDDFDYCAVCIETGSGRHVQLGAHLKERSQVEWLHQALLYLLTREES